MTPLRHEPERIGPSRVAQITVVLLGAVLLSLTAIACSSGAGSTERGSSITFTTTSGPECLDNGDPSKGEIVCVGDDIPDPESVELPPASDQPPSTLQFRVVRDDAATECSGAESNPSAAKAGSLSNSDGECLGLDAAGLEIRQVESVEATRQSGSLIVHLQLTTEDVKALNRFASRVLGSRVAIVIFGRVQSVVTVNATEFGSSLSISGISVDAAARMKAILT